jgi:hypothetical protein
VELLDLKVIQVHLAMLVHKALKVRLEIQDHKDLPELKAQLVVKELKVILDQVELLVLKDPQVIQVLLVHKDL